MKSGVLSRIGSSAPSNTISIASFFTPILSTRLLTLHLSSERTPSHRSPLHAGDMRREETAPLPNLIHGDHFHGWHCFEVVEIELDLAAGAFASDFEFPCLGVDFGMSDR